MLMLVVDGTDPELVADIGKTLIEADGHTGEALLSRLIMMEGILSVQAGENPRIIEIKLLSMLGERYLTARGCIGVESEYTGYAQQMAALAAQGDLPQCAEFNAVFETLGNRDIQAVLRETDQIDLCVALKGCNGKTGDKILSNCSKRLAAMLLEQKDIMGPVRVQDMLDAQEKIKEIVRKLREAGEIA
jgi:hypothetical protein